MSVSLPWNKINDFLLDCGSHRDPEIFSKRILDRIDGLIPFDQARLYFIDDNGSVYDECLLGVEKQVVSEYHEYYSQVDNCTYSIANRARAFRNHYPKVEDCIYDWNKYGQQEQFFQEYVRPYQIRHSFGLALRDPYNTMKCLFSLDRVTDIKYSEKEMAIMGHIRAHLDNLYQNFYVVPPESGRFKKLDDHLPLTTREAEVAELLMQGVTPIHISEKLCLSIGTVNKHIQNMHGKLRVSTRQELIVMLLSHST